MASIIPERVEHHEATRRVTVAAFAASEFGHNGEANLIDTLRANAEQVLSLVAVQDGEVVGHILFSPATIVCGDRRILGMGLAPMSVLPALQGNGIGSQLVKAGLAQLSNRDNAFTVVAGHPDFYPRFGFRPATEFGITHGFTGMPQAIFFVHCEQSDQLQEFSGGLAYYDPAFGPQHESA